MQLVQWLAAVLAAATAVVALPQRGADGQAVVLQETSDTGFSPYSFSYRTSNGISRQESGREGGAGGTEAEGAYSWTSPEGYSYTITWTADAARGYHAKVPQLLPGPATPRRGRSGFPWAR